MEKRFFTDKELKVARMRLQGLMNKEIAQELTVSEADISQTISRLTGKVKTVQDSVELLMKMDVIHEGPKHILTEKGRRLARIPKRKPPIPIEVHGVLWYDFETGWIYGTSAAFDTVYYHSHPVGQEKSISVFGITEAQLSTLTEKKGKTTSSTSEHGQPIEALGRAVLVL